MIFKSKGVSDNFVSDLLTDDSWDYLKSQYRRIPRFSEVVCAGNTNTNNEDHQVCAANKQGV